MRAFGIFVAVLIGVPLAFLVFGGFIFWASYNGLVNRDEAVKQSYAQIQNAMQRQADLIPNLIETVKGSAKFEGDTLKAVTEARAKLTAVQKLTPAELSANPELQKQLVEAQNAGGNLINMVREAYPQLQSIGRFAALMAELAGSQNRIAVERRKNQLAVQNYNQSVRRFPTNMVASWGGFTEKPYFEATAEGQRTPTVRF